MTSIEQKLRDEKHRRIGWAVLNMSYFARLWWALTGLPPKYLRRAFWDDTPSC